MATETASISYSPVPGFPAESVVDHIVVAITGSNPANSMNQNVAPGATTAVFNNVSADSYTFSISAVDASGNTFGTPVTGSFTVTAAQPVTLSLPSAATFAQS